MAKTNTPFLSFKSKGTVGGVLTTQKRGSATLLRSTPVPTDPYSLAQAYQRWDYKHYAYLWTLETDSSKQSYRSRGSRYHITGFSLWMREHLIDLSNLIGRWHLDELSGVITHDSSKQANNGIVFGAIPTTGAIAGAYSFDGLNDRIELPSIPILSTEDKDFTFEAFIHPTAYNAVWGSFIGAEHAGASLGLRATPGQLRLTKVDVADAPTSGQVIPLDEWSHVAVRFNSHLVTNNLEYYYNGDLVATVTFNVDFNADSASRYIGQRRVGLHFFEGYIDEVAFYDSLLDDTLIKRHSGRRYP